jgi:hypothetical protein
MVNFDQILILNAEGNSCGSLFGALAHTTNSERGAPTHICTLAGDGNMFLKETDNRKIYCLLPHAPGPAFFIIYESVSLMRSGECRRGTSGPILQRELRGNAICTLIATFLYFGNRQARADSKIFCAKTFHMLNR